MRELVPAWVPLCLSHFIEVNHGKELRDQGVSPLESTSLTSLT